METVSVLLASANKGLLQSLRKILENRAGIRLVGMSESKSRTLELSREFGPEVIVIDFDMLGDNFETSKQILKTNPDVKIIVLSMYDFVGRVTVKAAPPKGAPELEAVDWLSKRSKPAALLDLIAKVGKERRIQ